MKNYVLALLLCLSTVGAKAQEADTASLDPDFLLRQLRDPGQVSLGNGLGSVDSILYEARVFSYYYFRLKPGKLLWELSPGMHVRALTRHSFPIPMPSFYARSTVYYFPQMPSSNRWKYWSFQWSHHSNGKGNPTIVNGQPNIYGEGSFGTNFLWLGLHRISSMKLGQKDWGLSQYYGIGYNPDLIGTPVFRELYDDVRVSYRMQLFNRLKDSDLPKHEWRFYLDAYLFVEKFSMERLTGGHSSSLQFTASWRPFRNLDGSLFGQFYWGEEPYNLHFMDAIWRFQVGLLANPTGRNLVKDAKKF